MRFGDKTEQHKRQISSSREGPTTQRLPTNTHEVLEMGGGDRQRGEDEGDKLKDAGKSEGKVTGDRADTTGNGWRAEG